MMSSRPTSRTPIRRISTTVTPLLMQAPFHDITGVEATEPPKAPKSELAPVSALTLKLEGLQLDSDQTPAPTEAAMGSKWGQLRQDGCRLMGTSAPVWIPDRQLEWGETGQRLGKIQEEGQNEFIPPHLTVERPLIQFSLNSEIGRKRELFRAREKILTRLGVHESVDVSLSDAPEYHQTCHNEPTVFTAKFIPTTKAA